MIKSLNVILKEISEIKGTNDKINAIRTHRFAEAIKTIFKYTYDPNIKWLLPEGEPPYKPCEFLDVESRLLQELRRLYLYVEGGNDNLTPMRREFLFIQLLESIDPEDAKLVLSMKERKLHYKGMTKNFASQVFPDLFTQEEQVS